MSPAPGRHPTQEAPIETLTETTTRPLSRPPLKIRRARRPEMHDIADILRSTADWYAPFVDPADMDQHDVDAGWADKNYRMREFHVGCVDDDVIGCISIQEAGDALYLGYVYLHADRVGNGYGRKLLAFAREEARRRGKRALVLIAHPDADWAVRAYERFGFECIAEDRDDVLSWNVGWLRPYYEQGFHLFEYAL